MRKIVILVNLILLLNLSLLAQVIDPVKWTFESKQDGNEVTLIFKATIDEGWHLYDTKVPDGGHI